MTTLHPALAFLAICALLCGTRAQLHADDATSPLYLVLFKVVVGEGSKVQDFRVIKVIDLLSGSNNAIAVELPQAFINDARKKVEDERLEPTVEDGKSSSTLTSFLYSPADDKNEPPKVSFHALNSAMNSTSEFRLLGQDGAVSNFGANLGHSAFFVSYYALPLAKEKKQQREALIEAELQRNAANVQNAEILSRKDLSTDSQTIVEFTCRSPRNPALTIRSRYICNDRQMLAFAAITPAGLSPEDAQSFERLFEAFRFR
ncbi:hypothetical protein [Roseimicrobium sp. ORNL1]|uniref:hypothetical protein n=1 Tax=Roseimicrobium sp. ORNL1 TaxID=2711231 RepID=UPI0013E14100|nr:hypothetical protein [Roseimicrobium sp. ORNL1]QIF02487.1 hypothetical protein G5S37_13440 [Roseimicrobium sp. ORNL1]